MSQTTSSVAPGAALSRDSTPSNASWAPARHKLWYQAGEVVLGSAALTAVVCEAHFLSQREDAIVVPPAGPLPGVDAAVVLSQPLSAELPAFALAGAWIRYVPAHFLHHYVELDGDLDGYMRRLPSKYRQEMRRRVRRYAQGGELDCRVYRTPAEVAEFHRLAKPLSRRTYQERLLGRGLPSDAESLQRIAALAGEDRIRAFLLHKDGAPIAFGLCSIVGDVVSYHTTGYDPDMSAWSPGIVLLYGICERLFAEGRFRALDMGIGDSAYKREHATGTRRCATLVYVRPTLRNAALVGGHWALLNASRGAGRLLSRAGVKDRVRRLLRRMGR